MSILIDANKRQRKTDVGTLDVTQALAAYTAGMIDGEGSIQINPSKGGMGTKSYWRLIVTVSNNDIDTLKSLATEWGVGSVAVFKSRSGRNHRDVGRWSLYSSSAAAVLEVVLPYLRIKKERARIALEFRSLVGGRLGGSRILGKESVAKRLELATKMRDLNAFGIKGPTAVFPELVT